LQPICGDPEIDKRLRTHQRKKEENGQMSGDGRANTTTAQRLLGRTLAFDATPSAPQGGQGRL